MQNTDQKKSKTDQIFSSSIKNKLSESQPKNKNLKGSLYFILTFLFLIPYIVFFLVPQVQVFLGFDQVKADLISKIQQTEVSITDLTTVKEEKKSEYDAQFASQESIINKILPPQENKLEIIQLLENFATRLEADSPPFEFTSIQFQEPVKKEGYTILPFQTSIYSSQKNFERFLALISLSGDYSPESSNHIRLLEISNISLRYRGVDADGVDQGVDFTVQLNAYSS